MIAKVCTINSPVLVLNQNYQPLNICNAKRAIVLLGQGKAEVVIKGKLALHTQHSSFPVPSVVRLYYFVKRPLILKRLSRQGVFYRDGFSCQYCGASTKNLTIDHIIPRSRLGGHVWENVVSACIPCNHKKAGLTPQEARMRLLTKPRMPSPNPYYIFYHRQLMEEWHPFIPWGIP